MRPSLTPRRSTEIRSGPDVLPVAELRIIHSGGGGRVA
jgi:hypothetical protein